MPELAPHPCNKMGCRNLTTDRFCIEHKQLNSGWTRYHNGKSRHERGYGSKWDKIRVAIKKRDKGLCQPCLIQGKLTLMHAVDHIVSKAAGGTDNHSNLQCICESCHKTKTAREGAGQSSI